MPPHATSFPSLGPAKLSIKTKQHCLNVKQLMGQETGIIYLRGALNILRDDTDVEIKFRQESNFFYLTVTRNICRPNHLRVRVESKNAHRCVTYALL
ncbi:hypothetical protein BC943DRAFT_13013 [Umbelopsis sp. AD052]|nr:hypothetical protein BC943DRAFT_13013 [Umbelopsis sp. AD052]